MKERKRWDVIECRLVIVGVVQLVSDYFGTIAIGFEAEAGYPASLSTIVAALRSRPLQKGRSLRQRNETRPLNRGQDQSLVLTTTGLAFSGTGGS
jgi:hypothetical protein